MNSATRFVWRTLLCAVTIVACDIEGLDELLPHEDAGIDVDADSHTDVDSAILTPIPTLIQMKQMV